VINEYLGGRGFQTILNGLHSLSTPVSPVIHFITSLDAPIATSIVSLPTYETEDNTRRVFSNLRIK
jgi:hypothetical protein